MRTNKKNALYAFIAACALNLPNYSLAQCASPGAMDPIFQPLTFSTPPPGTSLTLRSLALENVTTTNGNRVVASFYNAVAPGTLNPFFLRRFASTPQQNDFEDALDVTFRTNAQTGVSDQGINYNAIGRREIFDIASGLNDTIFIGGSLDYNRPMGIAYQNCSGQNITYRGFIQSTSGRAYRAGGVSKLAPDGSLVSSFIVDWDSPNVTWPGNNQSDCVFSGEYSLPSIHGIAFDQTRNELYVIAKSGSASQRHHRLLRINGNTGDIISSFNIMTDANLVDRVVLEFDNPAAPQRLFVVHRNLIYLSSDLADSQNGMKSDLLLLDITQPNMVEINTNFTRAGSGAALVTNAVNNGQINDILMDPNSSNGVIYLAIGTSPSLHYGLIDNAVTQVTSLVVNYTATGATFSNNFSFNSPAFIGGCNDIAMDLCGRIIATANFSNGQSNALRRLDLNGVIDPNFICNLAGFTNDLLISPQNQIWVGSVRVTSALGAVTGASPVSVYCNTDQSPGFDYCKSYLNGTFSIQLPIPAQADPNISWNINVLDAAGNTVPFNPAAPQADQLFQTWINTINFNITWQVQVLKVVNSCGAICSHLEQWNALTPCVPALGAFNDAQLRSGTINSPVNLNSKPSFTTLTVYPNPSAGVFKIAGNFQENDPVQIQVFDVGGTIVKTKSLPFFQVQGEEIDLSGLPDGSYFLKITQNNTTINSKIVVD